MTQQLEKDSIQQRDEKEFEAFFIEYNFKNGNWSERHEDYGSRKYSLRAGYLAALESERKRSAVLVEALERMKRELNITGFREISVLAADTLRQYHGEKL